MTKKKSDLESSTLRLGYIPLTDCAPLIVGLEKGFFAEQGLEVELSKEPSWANIRDKVAYGQLDAAHMLAAMPLAATLGLDAVNQPMLTAFTLAANGNAITISTHLSQRLQQIDANALVSSAQTLSALKALIEQTKQDNEPPLRFAHVFPFSSHHYQLRQWMLSAGIDPNDVSIVVIPPPQMVMHLAQGDIDGFCVGEPWNTLAVMEDVGQIVATSLDIQAGCTEKVLGVTQEWAQQHPQTHQALIRALLKSVQWLQAKENRREASNILVQKHYIDAPLEAVAMSLQGKSQQRFQDEAVAMADFHQFYAPGLNKPKHTDALWFMQQMQQWGQLLPRDDLEAIAQQVYRQDLFEQSLD